VKIAVFSIILAALIGSLSFGQTTGGFGQQARDMTTEEFFLHNTVRIMVINEMIRSDNRDGKMLALENINEAISLGITGEEIINALGYLSSEGIRNTTRGANGLVINNFPDVRRISARTLSRLPAREVNDVLLQLLLDENEPMVIQEVIRSIGVINLPDDGTTMDAIVFAVQRLDRNNPDNLVAVAAIDTLGTLAQSNNLYFHPGANSLLVRISEGIYTNSVKERARAELIFWRTQSVHR